MSSSNIFTRLIRGAWNGLDTFRRLMHLFLMLAVFAVLLAAFLSGGGPDIPKSAALMFSPSGAIVEQPYGDAIEQAFEELSGSERPQTGIRDLVEALRAARDDERIKVVALDLGNVVSADLSKLQRLGKELEAVRATGRTVIAYGDFYSQAQYYLAAHADEVYLHPSGVVFLDGYGRFRTFYREAIDKLKIDWHVFRVGEFKSFVEPYLRDDMSPEDRSSSMVWLSKLWDQYQEDVAAVRGLEPRQINEYAANFTAELEARGGDLGRVALDAGLVDELRTRDYVRQRMIELVGEDAESHSFSQIGFRPYLKASRKLERHRGEVAVVMAAGEILDGEQPPGQIGGDTLARLLRNTRHDDSIKAVVLRIDSPGGSKFASEVIQREVQLLREAGKPVIASMGGVAASGGYFIAMDADEIWATPVTITGSIGIGAYLPTFSRSLDALGVHVDGVGTTPWSGQFRLDRDLSEGASKIIQLSVEYGYRDFINGVANARNMAVEQVDKIARGRVWTGETAKELGLVDKLGGLDAAIESAASHAALGDDYKIRYIEKELSLRESLALGLATHARSLLGIEWRTNGLNNVISQIADDLGRLAKLNDPQNLYYHCLCDIR
ncbi:MAG: signal peptide peptidase SppA [Gammaproteobacteria bacterium]|nr:signal peptide peptidase SppA [Gammaproteobacteria bacterium]MDH3768041.1 signal peptide peptidase SppA [Gammaproteobacteria bacterium]